MSKEKHGKKKDKKSKSKKDESKSKKDEKTKLNEQREFGKGKVDSFDQLVKENKLAGRSWYHGFEGKWWWGMTEENVRTRLVEVEQILGKIKPVIDTNIIKEDKHIIDTKEDKPVIDTDINKEDKPLIDTDIIKEDKPVIDTNIIKEDKPVIKG